MIQLLDYYNQMKVKINENNNIHKIIYHDTTLGLLQPDESQNK